MDGAVVQDTSVHGDVREIWETLVNGGGKKYSIPYRDDPLPYGLVHSTVPLARVRFEDLKALRLVQILPRIA